MDAAVRAARTETAGAYTVDADGNVLETFRADDHGGDGYIAALPPGRTCTPDHGWRRRVLSGIRGNGVGMALDMPVRDADVRILGAAVTRPFPPV